MTALYSEQLAAGTERQTRITQVSRNCDAQTEPGNLSVTGRQGQLFMRVHTASICKHQCNRRILLKKKLLFHLTDLLTASPEIYI